MSFRPRRHGGALVIVLAILTLMLVLIVGFLARSGAERTSAGNYQAGMNVRLLAGDAVHLVQAQIDHAARAGAGLTWTSQPGLVRVFDNTGAATAAYKLYSASSMSANAANPLNDLPNDLPGAGWTNAPAVWVDINQAARVGGEDVFPVMDPRVRLASETSLGAVEGFSITELPGATGRPGAMPVRWLYVLQNGEKVTPVSSSGTQVTFDSSVVTGTNPIVGRVAFWTDDESCKLNVNTAGEGTYWDVPRAFSVQEETFGNFQPAQGEYARYPGHPAAVSLSAVFPELDTQEILSSSLSPRYRWGGSQAGTLIATGTVSPKTERLYTSPTETLFQPDRTRLQLPPGSGSLPESEILRRGFFLTAHSRAPETNLFNLPRVAIWPLSVTDNATHRTQFDQLVARCSTINGHPYFFQRELATSPTHDFTIPRNLELYNYLSDLTNTEIPAFGGRFTAKYPGEVPQILTEIFDYIRCANLVDPKLEQTPAGVVFTAKADLSSASPHNMTPGYGTVTPIRHPSNSTMGFGRFYTLAEFSLHFICTADAGDGSNPEGRAQSNIPPTGPGSPLNRNLTLDLNTSLAANERRIQAMVHLRLFSPAQGWVTMHPRLTVEVSGLNGFTLNAQPLFPASANGSIELGRWAPDQGINATAYGGNVGVFYPLFSKRATARGNLPADASGAGAEDVYPFISNFVTVNAVGGTMSFGGGPVTVRIFSGNTLGGPAPQLVQTINLTVPGGNFPIPSLLETLDPSYSSTPQYFWAFAQNGAQPDKEARGRLYGIARRQGEIGYGPAVGLFTQPEDVIRSLVPRHGDLRLIAGKQVVPATEFVKHPEWDTVASRYAHHLYQSRPDLKMPYWPSTALRGSHVDPVNLIDPKYRAEIPYESSRSATQAVVNNKDWDTGTAYAMDGAYINKPDEGNTYRDAGVPYMGATLVGTAGFTFFSPNRQMPSPGMFGSLSAGVTTSSPWRTLLFRPEENHPAWGATPKDHLFMDLFWMPVVEPYAISEPFSTAGKLNMNYQIFPFTNIERSTGIHALLKSEKLAAIPVANADSYKRVPWSGAPIQANVFRQPIAVTETLKQFKARFDAGNVFRSASEICDLDIIPQGGTATSAGVWTQKTTFWNNHRITGENMRERIYTTLYPRLTTRSNTFTVHVWAQALKPSKSQPAHVWEERGPAIVGSYRGSTTIERFIDPNNTAIPDYASGGAAQASLDNFYRWRTVGNVQFAP